MKTYTSEEFKKILAEHAEWVRTGMVSGTRANLNEANLREADLSGADLGGATRTAIEFSKPSAKGAGR